MLWCALALRCSIDEILRNKKADSEISEPACSVANSGFEPEFPP